MTLPIPTTSNKPSLNSPHFRPYDGKYMVTSTYNVQDLLDLTGFPIFQHLLPSWTKYKTFNYIQGILTSEYSK